MNLSNIDTSARTLSLSNLYLDIMSCDSENDSDESGIMAPVVHDRGIIFNCFEFPPQGEVLAHELKFTGEQPSSKTEIVLDFLKETTEQDKVFDGELAPISHQRHCFLADFKLTEEIKKDVSLVKISSENKKPTNSFFISHEVMKMKKDSMKVTNEEASTNGSSIQNNKLESSTDKMRTEALNWKRKMEELEMSDFDENEDLN